MVTDQSLNNNGWPERYFAVIFTAQRSLSGDDIYDITADRMVLLARRQPGFLGVESVRGDDGIGITVSYWVDRDAIANWRQQAEHLAGWARATRLARAAAENFIVLIWELVLFGECNQV